MQSIRTFMMFTGNAAAAIELYCSLFGGSVVSMLRYGAGEAGVEGSVKHAVFELRGQHFVAIDSYVTHAFSFTPAMSQFVSCGSVAELEALYAGLSEGGQVMMPLGAYPFAERYAWLSDRFGVSWQLSYGPLQF